MAKHGILGGGETIVKLEQPVSTEYKATLSKFLSIGKQFPIDTFKGAFMTWVICDNITFRQSASKILQYMFSIIDILAPKVLPSSNNTTCCWILSILVKEKNTILELILTSGSRVSISFDAWTSDTSLSLLGIVAQFLSGRSYELHTLLLGLSEIYGHTGDE